MLLTALRAEHASRFMHAVGGEAAAWSPEMHAHVSVIDRLDLLIHQYVQAHTTRRLPPWRPMKRPGMEQQPANTRTYKAPKALPLDKLRELTERWRTGGGGEVG